MSSLFLPQLIKWNRRYVHMTAVRYQRTPFPSRPKKTVEERYRVILAAHEGRGLKLAESTKMPLQWKAPEQPPDPKILTKERKLPSMAESAPPYKKYSHEEIDSIQKFETYYDPLFNPHLHEQRHTVNPDEEPFNAIYQESKSEATKEYTGVRNITSPELWEYVERLARIKVAPSVARRKPNEEPKPLPSGFYPPPDCPPDLPYFIPRTRNHLLPVYYILNSDPNKCVTTVHKIDGDLWQFERDLRTHLEEVKKLDKILTSVQETDARVEFKGRHLHEIVDWLHMKGF